MHYELNQSESNELQKQKSIVEGKKKVRSRFSRTVLCMNFKQQ